METQRGRGGGKKKRGCGGKKEAVHDDEQRLKGKRGLRLEEGKAGLRRSGSEVRGWGYEGRGGEGTRGEGVHL